VSRPTLREALIALAIARLDESRTGSWNYFRAAAEQGEVAAARLPELGVGPLELIEARLVVECAVARTAAPRATPANCTALEARIAEMDAAPNPPAHLAADRGFHRDLARISGNAVLASVVDGLWAETFSPIFERMGLLTGLYPVSRNTTREDHLRIAAAMRTGDPNAAEAAMRRHLSNVGRILMGGDTAEHDA
jgi:DNA-binding FadR family transcriptional regulator